MQGTSPCQRRAYSLARDVAERRTLDHCLRIVRRGAITLKLRFRVAQPPGGALVAARRRRFRARARRCGRFAGASVAVPDSGVAAGAEPPASPRRFGWALGGDAAARGQARRERGDRRFAARGRFARARPPPCWRPRRRSRRRGSRRRDGRAGARRRRSRRRSSGRRARARATATWRAGASRRRSRASRPLRIATVRPFAPVNTRSTCRASAAGAAPRTASSASRLAPRTRSARGRWDGSADARQRARRRAPGRARRRPPPAPCGTPATVSIATGSCSTTSMRSPWGKLGLARTARTTCSGATAASSAPGAHVERAHATRRHRQRRLHLPRLGAVHAADPHVLDGDEARTCAATASHRRAAAARSRAASSATRRRRAAREEPRGGARDTPIEPGERGAAGAVGCATIRERCDGARRAASERVHRSGVRPPARRRTPTRESARPRASAPPARGPRRSARARGGDPPPSAPSTSAVVAVPVFSMKFACLGAKRAPPMVRPLQPASASSRPALRPSACWPISIGPRGS